jgi:hypothetical protein
MPHNRHIYVFTAAALLVSQLAFAQDAPKKYKAPTVADWTAVGKLPDFTGVWEIPMGGGGRGGAGRGAAAAGAPGAARGGAPAAAPGRAGRGMAAPPQLTPEYAAKAKEMAATAAGARAEDAQTANCLPPGLPAIMGQPYPIELLMTPGMVTVVIEAYTQVRHIYTDGRPIPEDPDPSFNGTSIGRWEGDTLVVDSVGFEPVARGINFPWSEKMKITERLHLSDPDTLNIETTITDPLALTQPYPLGNRVFKRHRAWTIAEYVCEENNRNFVDPSGKAGINLANPTASPK